MKAVITVIGKDTVGIIAKVATLCAEYSANIEDITQSVLKEYFAMIMLTNIDELNCDFPDSLMHSTSSAVTTSLRYALCTRTYSTLCTLYN